MIDHEHFIKQIQADADPRLAQSIYADWLEEQGDERSKILRAGVEIAKAVSPMSATDRHPELRLKLQALFPKGRFTQATAWENLARIPIVSGMVTQVSVSNGVQPVQQPVWYWWYPLPVQTSAPAAS